MQKIICANWQKVVSYKSLATLDIRALVINAAIALMLFSTMFLNCRGFVESEIASKWYAFTGGSVLLGFGLLVLIKRPKIAIDKISILAAAFIFYLFARIFFSGSPQPDIFILSIASFASTYLSFKLIDDWDLHNTDLLIVIACLLQAVYGLLQYIGIFYVSRGFDITGSFDNPAGFAACLSAGFPFCLAVMRKSKRMRLFGLAASAIITLSIILSGSRAGILAVVIVAAVYLGHRYCGLLRKHRNFIFPLSGIIFVILVAGLLLLKKNSALGRILIWKNTCEMISHQPVSGFGPSGFMREYMLCQADYFAKNTDSPYALLAGNVTHPFNEYLLVAIEYGAVGLLPVLAAFVFLIKSSRQITIPHLCILSAAVFACFSYPLRYSFVTVLLAYSLAAIKIKPATAFRINGRGKFIWAALLGVIGIFLIRDVEFEKHWGRLARQDGLPDKSEILDRYAALHAQWNGDPMFLYNYGAVLNHAGDYSGSNAVMFQCTDYFNDYDVQRIIADNYDNMNNQEKAEEHYIIASRMIPNRFVPLYQLFRLYEKNGRTNEAMRTAKAIIEMPVKVQSNVVERIRSAAKAFLSETDAEKPTE